MILLLIVCKERVSSYNSLSKKPSIKRYLKPFLKKVIQINKHLVSLYVKTNKTIQNQKGSFTK